MAAQNVESKHTPSSFISRQSGSFIFRFGWRGVGSAVGTLVWEQASNNRALPFCPKACKLHCFWRFSRRLVCWPRMCTQVGSRCWSKLHTLKCFHDEENCILRCEQKKVFLVQNCVKAAELQVKLMESLLAWIRIPIKHILKWGICQLRCTPTS